MALCGSHRRIRSEPGELTATSESRELSPTGFRAVSSFPKICAGNNVPRPPPVWPIGWRQFAWKEPAELPNCDFPHREARGEALTN